MALIIPIRPRVYDQTLAVVLGGVRVRLRVRWHESAQSWRLDVSDAAGAPMVQGRGLRAGEWPLSGLPASRRPPGGLLVWDTESVPGDSTRRPGADELGDRVLLLWYSDAEQLPGVL